MADEMVPSATAFGEELDKNMAALSGTGALSQEYDRVTGARPANSAAPGPKYDPLFQYDDAAQTDRDYDGSLTQRIGAARGLDYGPDKVLEVNLYGEVVSEDTVRALEGGGSLLTLLSRKRQGRRGLTEAVTTGSATDFIPYVGDLASTGIAIKNMKVVRDAFRKMSEQGPQALTLQEKVLTKLYQEDMERQSNQTFGGKVGTILRQAPAFAGEFLLTGGLFKAGAKALGFAARETAEELVEKSVKNSVKKLAVDKMRNAGATRAALDFTDDIAKLSKGVFDDAVKGGATEAKAAALKNIAEKTAQATAMAYKNPSRFKNFVEFVGDYGRRGLFDHMDDVVRDLPPGVRGKLREAAGVAFVEAPIKGFLYSAFDFMAVNPAVASVMGADEAVTKTELGLYSSGDRELMDNAKMLAFGTAWAEYASEGAGRAFTALGGIVEEAAGQVGRKVARSGLRARADFVKEGSIARRLYDYMVGTEQELKAGLASLKQEAVEAAVKANSAVVAGKTVGQVLADTDLTDKVMKGYLGFRDKSFIGYWVANKALERNITPQAVTRLLENMGYDDILGEFMEERYNGFAQGLFGLDGQEHDSNIERIAHAVKSAVPSFQQGLAEIVAFSVPTIARAATSRAYEFIGAGQHGKFKKAAESIASLNIVQNLIINREGKPAKYIDIRSADAGTGSAVSVFTEKAGKVSGSGEYMAQLDTGVDALVDAIPTYTNAREGKVGLGLGVARAVLGTANAIITGNPVMAFRDPLKALARQTLGEGGAHLLNSAANSQKALYVRELARRAGKTAQEIEDSGEASKLTEAGFNDPSILEAIRPDLKAIVRYLVKEHLRTRGTVIEEDQDVDAYLDEQMKMKSEDGKLAGLTREEFREKFFDELAGAAAGRMTMDIVNGQVNTVYRKPAEILDDTSYASVAASVEEFLNQQHINSFMHGSEVTSPDALRRNLSGTPIDISDLELARGTGQERNSAEVDRARMRLVMKMFPNPDFAAPGNWELYMSKAAHTAAVLLEAHKNLMRPQFDMGGQRVEVKGGVGDFYLGEALGNGEALGDGKVAGTASYATIEEAVAAAQALGAKPAKAQMYFTSSNTFVTLNASALLSNETGSRGYLLEDRDFDHRANPFMTMTHAKAKKQVEADLALAAAWDNRKQTPFKNAADEVAAKAAYDKALGENGYETLARKAAEKAGIKRYGTPDQRGERGFIFEPAAISTGGSVFISYARIGSAAAIIEDAFETAAERNLAIFVDPKNPRTPKGKLRNSTVVRALMEACQNELQVLIEDEALPLRTRDEARYLSDLFDPEIFNIEAIGHAAPAFVFYQGDTARTAGSGSALYATLGHISKKIRGNTAVYYAFASLVNRAAGGGILTQDGGALSGMVSGFLPPNLRDVSGVVRPVVQGEPDFSPVDDLKEAGKAVASDVRIALDGTPRSGFLSKYGTQAQKNEQAFYKREIARLRQSAVAGGNVREYLDEELPFLLEEIKGARNAAMLERGRDVIINEEKTPEQKAAEAAEAAAAAHKEKLDNEPGASSASMATDMLENHPAFAIRLAEGWMSRKPVSAADRRGRFDQVFDEWMLHDPLLSGDDRRRFFDAATKAGLMSSGSEPVPDLESDPSFGSAFDAMFGLDETYDEGETQNVVAEVDDEGGEKVPSSEGESNFNQDAVARALENDTHVGIIRGVMRANLPAAQNDQEALEMLFDMSSAMYERGSKDPKSVASLFDGRAWTSGVTHPALVDEDSFREWLEVDRPENGDVLFDDLIWAMRVIGLDGVFKAVDKMKGSYVKSVYAIEVVVDADGQPKSVDFRPRMQSMSIEAAISLSRSAKAGVHDPSAAVALLEAEPSKGTVGRLGRLAEAAELMFGKHNFLSQTLRKTKVRDMVTRRVVTEADKTYNTLFNSYGKIAPAGLVALRLLNAAKLLSEGKQEAAVRELMRGDAAAQGDASNRGGVSAFLNDAAGLIPVSSAARMGEAAGKVRTIDAATSDGYAEFLLSKNFSDAYVAAGGDLSTLDRDVHFGKWADGTPVFAAVSGISRRSEAGEGEDIAREDIANPSYDEVAALSELDYGGKESAVVKVALYNSEKEMERLVAIPRVALSALTGMETPSYSDTLRVVSRLMRISELSPKRGAHHMAGGAAAELQNAEVALMLVGDTAARENMHGVGYIGSPELAGYYRRQGFGSAAKVILTESPTAGGYTFFAKGQFILADTDVPDGAVTPAEKDIRRIAKNYAYLSDMDSFKETALYYKAADGRKVMDLILAGENAVTVKLPDGTEKSVSDIAAELFARVTKEKVNGNPVTILSIRMGLRSQWASAPSKLAEPKHVEVPVNYAMDNKEMWAALNKQSSVKAALAARVKPELLQKIYAGLPDPVRRLVDAGVSVLDPDIMKSLGPKLASAFTKAFKPTMYGVQYLNRNFDGARVLEGADGTPYVSDPLGGMDVLGKGLIHDTYVMEDGTRRLASTAVNLGGMTSRYGNRVIPAALDLADGDIAGIMEAVETRVRLLKAAELRSLAEGDESIYLRAYAEHIDGAFTDGSGNPLMPGQILSFSDLVDRDGKFDSTRLYESSDANGAFVFLNGQLNISGRTPSRDGKRAEYAHVAAMPAYMEEADGTQFYMALSTDRNGNLVGKRTQYPIGTEQNPVLVPGRDAVLKMTPMAKWLAGSDDDWDKSHSQRMPTDRLGCERVGVNGAEAKIAAAETDEEAEQIADQAVAGLESEGFWAAVNAHRTLDPMTNPVTATPFTKDYQDKMIPKKPNPKLDTVEAAAFAAQNKEAQVSRAISVSVLGNLVAAIDTGMLFSKSIPGSALRKPEGAKAAYWDSGFAVGPGVPWTPTRIRTFISAASGIANSTFDDLKESLAARAGFRPEFLDLYLYLAFESGVETQEAYEQFHTAFMEWMNGPDGLMVSEAFRNAKYPAKYGGSRLSARLKATSMELYSAADSESGDAYHYRYFRDLSMPHRDLVTALALANGGGVKGFDAVFPTVLALDRLRLINAVGNVLAYKKANLAFPEKVEAMDRRIDTVLRILNNKKIGANFSAFGREAVVGALTAASAMSAQAREALKGTVELSPLYIAAIEGGFTSYNKAMSGGMRVQKAVKRSINTRLPFEAAVRMTPASTGAKIDAIRAAEQPGRATAGFLSAVESVLKELYRNYADIKGKPNAALDALLAPGTGSKATRIMTVGSDGTAAAAAELRASMEAMRDWTVADKSLPVMSLRVDKKPMQITPADFYWMLMQYSCLTVEKSVETGRATQSLLSAFFGPAVYRKISDYQVAELESLRDPGRLLKFTQSNTTDYNNVVVRKRALNAIPAAMERDASLKWGSYDEYMKSIAAEEAKPASVEETPAPEAVKPAPVVAADPVAAQPQASSFKAVRVTVRPGLAAAITAKETAKYGTGTVSGVIAAEGTGGQTQHAAEEAKAQGALNPASFTPGATYVVVIPGKGRGFTLEKNGRLNPPYDKVVAAIEAGAIIRADNKANAFRSWNAEGEGALYTMLDSLGYAVKNGSSFAEWAKSEELLRAAQLAAPAVNHTPESAAWKNVREQAKAVAAMTHGKNQRRLFDFARRGAAEPARMTDAMEAAAGDMGRALTGMTALPWLAAVPGHADTLRAADAILAAMRFPEPAVFAGAVRALGRAAVAAKAADAVPQLAQLIKAAGVETDDARLDGLIADSAKVLSGPAAVRVMEFAIASDKKVSEAYAKVTTRALSRGILAKLGVPERSGEATSASVSADELADVAADAAFGPVTTASMAADEIQSDLRITDEELQAYMDNEKAGKYYAAETLQDKFQKRLKALFPPMPDEFKTTNGDRYSKRSDGSFDLFIADEGVTVTVFSSDAKSAWDGLNKGERVGEYAITAQAIEDWKRDEGVVYNPNDAYSRGEGFYHDIGAFNSKAPGLIGGIAKVLLAQEKKRRAGDMRYWEDTANQLVVSAYTSLAGPVWEVHGVISGNNPWGTGSGTSVERVFTTEAAAREYAAAQDALSPIPEGIPRFDIDGNKIPPRKRTVRLQKIAGVRPGSGLRLVIRPSSQNILWAAKGDVYSGTVFSTFEMTPEVSLTEAEYEEYLSSLPIGFLFDVTSEGQNARITKTDTGWVHSEIVFESGETFPLSLKEAAAYAAFAGVSAPSEVPAHWDRSRPKTIVAPKAPQADKLSLLSHTLAGAIEDRRPQNYNELGVRLALGNFYIEETAPRKVSGVATAFEKNGEWFVKDQFTHTTKAASKAAAEAEANALNEELLGVLPKELRRLNEHLKRAFIAVHGSLDPVAPYTPKTVNRAAGPVSASMAEIEAMEAEADAMGKEIRQAKKRVAAAKIRMAGSANDIKAKRRIGQTGERWIELAKEQIEFDTRLIEDLNARVGILSRAAKEKRAAAKAARRELQDEALPVPLPPARETKPPSVKTGRDKEKQAAMEAAPIVPKAVQMELDLAPKPASASMASIEETSQDNVMERVPVELRPQVLRGSDGKPIVFWHRTKSFQGWTIDQRQFDGFDPDSVATGLHTTALKERWASFGGDQTVAIVGLQAPALGDGAARHFNGPAELAPEAIFTDPNSVFVVSKTVNGVTELNPNGPTGVSASMAAAEELAEIIKSADAAIGKADYADKYAQRAFPNNKILRKRLVTPESVAARVPAFLGTQPDGRKLLFGHVTNAIREIESLKSLGKAKDAMLYTLGVFFKPATNQTEWQDFENFNGKRYGEFMGAVGNSQARAADALLDARKAAESLSGPDKKAALANVEKAERAFFSALLLARSAAVALRPRVNRASNPLRAQIAALENERITPPANLPPDDRTPAQQAEDHIAEVSLIDPDTGHPDPSDDFRVTFVSSDEWFYSTVFPNFRGADIRQILFDKEALAITPAAFAVANRVEAYFGVDSATGSLRKITRAKGMGNHLADGGYVFDGDSAADVMVMGRRKIVREQADILSGNAFDDNEFALTRWFCGDIWHYMGDGGMKAKHALAGEVKFDLKWGDGAEKLGALVSYAEALRRVGGTGENRPYAVHELLIRAKESLPAELFSYAENALREAVMAGAKSAGNKSQAALKALEQSGFAVARRREIKDAAGAVTGTELYDVRLAIPVSLTARVFAASTAHGKLVKNGRVAEELTLEANAALLKGAFAKIDASVNAMGWTVNGDARLFSDAGSGVPFFKGSGAWQYFARKLDKPVPPEYAAAVAKAYESLRDMFPKMRRTTRDGDRPLTGAEAAQSDSFARMFNLLRDLHPQTFGEASTPQAVWQSITVGRASGLGLDASSTAWDIAKAVYAGSVSRLHESAWLGGTVQATDVFTVGLEAFNRAIGEAAEQQNVDLGRAGATFSEIYDHTGALPQNLTAGEALALHARQVADMTRYRGTVNQMLMTSGEDGMPLVYARPGLNQNDDTVPDRMWGMLARWWAETGSDAQGRTVAFDESLSGRENATRIFDQVTAGKESEDTVQTSAGGLRRYILTDVKIPQGMESFSAVKAMKDPAGDDTKAVMNVFGGGEAANVVRQVFAIAGYGRSDARLAGMNRALSWSKSASVMASLFFPIATAFESPVAAVGMGPTLLGLTKPGADAARWLAENQGWIAKAFGVDDIAQAPFMAEILRVIGSDDPALIDLKVHNILCGISLADRAHNMTDPDRTVLAQDIAWVTAQARALMGSKASKSLKAILEGAMEHSSEFAFEYIINATKMAVFAQMTNRMRQKAIAAGRWWDPVRDMKKWAHETNVEVGGTDPATYPWMTPLMQQVLKALMFSWEWTLGAWEAGGGGVLTQKLFGYTTPPHMQKFILGRWVRMYGGIMIGLPMVMQSVSTAVAKAAGEGDDDDKWFSGHNEKGHGWKDFDITPLLRTIANAPVIPFTKFTWGDLKKKEIPFISALIPALTGQEGDKPTTRKRRYYMHMGKQGWEVAGWFENPTRSFLSKMSMPAQKILEGVLGITPSMGWEKPFAELSFWERWTSLDTEKSALLNLGTAFLPFSLQGAQRNPEIGALAAIGPTGKGMSKTRAEKEMARMFETWGNAESYIAMRKGKPGAWTDLTGMATEWLEALRLNGYDPETSLKNALAAARKPLYEQVHNALPAFPDGKADTKELEAAARGLYRLDFVAKNLMKSIKARDKAQHIKRSGELGDITDALLRDAFENPYGRKADGRLRRSAAGGGDVRKLLASDKLPRTVLGYKVLKTEELSESDLAFFRDNPESPGFYDKETK